ncbi:MAG: hypothetical protein IPJ71_11795 [Bdellovibrionales bacterium]|nr:hypothetical protein [Bdellovibrionales bacterium]
MSWTIGLYIGESFAEISAKQDDQAGIPFWRWYQPQIPLAKGIQRFVQEHRITEIKEVRIATRLARQIIARRLGQNPAFLVTEGFENWPTMNLPVINDHFSIRPNRTRPPLSSHLIFGLTGRINAQGEEEKPLDPEELEFLVAKLKLNKVSHAVLGLLHATMNPSHEKQVEEFLKEHGLRVYPSYNLPLSQAEKPRWWHSILNAYLEPAFKVLMEQIVSGFGTTLKNESLLQLILGDSAPAHKNWDSPLGSLFGSAFLLNEARRDPSEAVLYMGLEEFFLLPGHCENQLDWMSDFGRVSLQHVETRELLLQPSTVITKSIFGCPTFSREVAGFEPGPMCFGKGVNPLFLDLLFANDRLGDIEVLHHHLNPKMGQRVKETFGAYSREALAGSNYGESDILNWMEETALNLFASEIRSHSRSKKIRTTGPMSSVMVPLLEPLLSECQLSPLFDFNQPLCEQLLNLKESQ